MTASIKSLLCLAVTLGLTAASSFAQDNFVPLFNGRDLTGWVNVNCAPNTFSVRDGMIYCTGLPTGVLRTDRHYENFIIELEWKHMVKGGNAGLFIYSDPITAVGQPFTRSIEIQVLDRTDPDGMWTGHGDMFSIHGATFLPDRPHPKGWLRCLPSEYRAHPTGEWNHYRVESRDGKLTLAVNGKVVSGGTKCNPRKGYICLESEGGQVYWRNLRIQELPPSNPPKEEIAATDEGFKSIYTGVDLSGWRDAGQPGWKVNDWILESEEKPEAQTKHLWTQKEYGDFVLIADWRLTGEPKRKDAPSIKPNGEYENNPDGSRKTVEIQDAGDSGIYLRGAEKAEINIGSLPVGSGELLSYRDDRSSPAKLRSAATPKLRADRPLKAWNRFMITMRGDRLTVVLNDKTVIENAQIPGLPARGPIGLQHRGHQIQFANLYVKELNR